MEIEEFDYIVVGAGAAGSPVANRLSAVRSHKVLLLEAGGKDSNPLIHLPMGFTKLTTPDVNWGFSTVPQPELNNRRMHYPQGRTLGGSTSINAMIYIRGAASDFDQWAAEGADGWAYQDVLPFFRKSEHHDRLLNEYHGGEGPMRVGAQAAYNPISQAFVKAGQELGLPYNQDFNGREQFGVGFYDVTQRNHRRESAATAYLHRIRKRTNLTVRTRSMGTRLIIKNNRVIGLEYTTKGKPRIAYARKEVVLSSGAVNTPRLMLASGIGPADELESLGIKVKHSLPGVGKNFQDHMDVYLTSWSTPVSYNESDRPHKMAWAGMQYLMNQTGPATATVCEAGMFVRSSENPDTPDIQMHILPAFVIDHGRQRVRGHGFTINTCNLRPTSIGSVTLQSADIAAPPLIDPNFLATENDWKLSLEGFEWGREVLGTRSFSKISKGEHMPGKNISSDAQKREYVKKWAKTDYHPVGSCKIGTDPMSVVDSSLRVHGIEGLRVVDASVMPKLISGNTQAASIMIGEKGAHHILQDA